MVFGLSALMLFVGTLEDDFQDRLIGIETHYGDSEKWERSIQRANRTLDQRQKPQLVPNDGRPPDTSKNLLNSRQKETSKPQSGPGRPRGSKNVDRNLGTTYQSYMHYNNTCYITSLLECLFTIMRYCEIAYSSSQGICSTIFSHFERRRSNQMQEKKLARDLKQTLIAVAKWVTEEVKLYSPGGYGNPFTVLNQILLECPQDMQALWSFHFQV